jgi:hypothetical protein
MTNFLLGLILFWIMATGVIRAWFAREDARRGYTAPCEVEYKVIVCNRSQYHIRAVVEMMTSDKWELVSAHLTKNGNEIMFFTRKKIKTYYDGK